MQNFPGASKQACLHATCVCKAVLLLLVDGVRLDSVSAVVLLNTHSHGKATSFNMHDFLESYSGLCDRVVMYELCMLCQQGRYY